MTDFIKQFVEFLHSVDCAPASGDLTADDKRHYYQLEGDRRGVKKGVYCLLVDENGAVGWCKNYRDGVIHGWSSKVKREWSAEEKSAWKKRIADKKIADEVDSLRLRQDAMAKASSIMKASVPADSHPYLTRKGIKAVGAYICPSVKLRDDFKEIKKALVIPAYKNGKLSTLQVITEEGDKLFLPDGDMDGSYGVIKSGSDMSVIYICEGFATGASIHEATGRPVVVAFNAGNLKSVAVAIRGKYNDARIVIAADNDAWRFKYPRPSAVKAIERDKVDGDDPRWEEWRTSGWLENKGIIEARQAAVAIGGAVVLYPEFEDIKNKPTDWNDGHKACGLDWIKIRLEAISTDRAVGTPVPQLDDVVVSSDSPPSINEAEWHEYLSQLPPIESYNEDVRAEVGLYESHNDSDYDKDWKEKLHYDDKGNLTSKSLNNVSLMLANAPSFKDMFCYDEFAHEKIIVQCPPWEKPEKFKPRPITDEDLTWLCVGLEKIGLTLNMMVVKKILDAVIMKKRRNPAREYFNSLEWDGVKRLDKWLSYYAGAESDDATYLASIGTIWMVAAVTRVFHPGHKFDHMLILEGVQGAGKSSLLRELSTIYGKEYFDDTIKANELGQTAIVPKLQGVLIVEIAELAGMRKADIETFKQQITIQDDRIVKKYSNEPTRYPRQFILAGTFNLIQGYLDDPTGNRRFWPCKVGKIDLEALRKDKAQLWAEAVVLYRQGLPLYLNDEMRAKLLITQESRKIVHPWMPDLEGISRDKQFVSSKEIWEALQIERSKRTMFASNDIAKIMVELGYEYGRVQNGGVRQYGWSKKSD